MNWRGRRGPGAGVLMVEEMAVIKLRSQLSLCRGFRVIKLRFGFRDSKRKSEALDNRMEKRLKRAAS